ncbi:hypothetical protein C8R45DRAFT_144165 [Mycena sanguinolenta]|nr:hypothetical protein C8R45DRAFT_144165 [Mycena sanguinolenta]
MSGNGFKKKAYTTLSDSLNSHFPNRPAHTKDQVRNRISYIKRAFELWEYVRGKSGVGWDDEKKMASAETEFIDRFVEEYGTKYRKCFEKTCPFYDRLSQLFGGNKATGANVLHLPPPRLLPRLPPMPHLLRPPPLPRRPLHANAHANLSRISKMISLCFLLMIRLPRPSTYLPLLPRHPKKTTTSSLLLP